MKHTHNAEKTTAKLCLTNTEKTWRVGRDCFGIELLSMSQRHEVHNLKTIGYTLQNVTPTGNALLSIHGSNGYTQACISSSGEVSFSHFDK
jgi:uncharacterized protein YerC